MLKFRPDTVPSACPRRSDSGEWRIGGGRRKNIARTDQEDPTLPSFSGSFARQFLAAPQTHNLNA